MAEEAPVVQNKWLLIVAGLLALVVVVIYNVHVDMVRNSLKGQTITLLQVNREMRAGEKVKAADLQKVDIPKLYSGNLENVVPGDAKNYNWVLGQTLTQDITKNQYLTWAHLGESGGSAGAANKITPGMESFTFQINPGDSPGQLLRVGGHINIYGLFSVSGKGPQTCLVMEGATVLTIEGRASRDKSFGSDSRTTSDDSLSSFRTISIEVSPDVARKLSNIQTYLIDGKFRIAVRSPQDNFPATPPGPIIYNKESDPVSAYLKSISATANPAMRSTGGGGGFGGGGLSTGGPEY